MEIVKKFFINIFNVFLDRVNPDSTMAKPACIKNTRSAATIIQTISKDIAKFSTEVTDSALTLE